MLSNILNELMNGDHGFAIFATWPLMYGDNGDTSACLIEHGFHFYFLSKRLVAGLMEYIPTDSVVFVPNSRGDDPELCVMLAHQLIDRSDQRALLYMPHNQRVLIVEDVSSGTKTSFDCHNVGEALAAFERIRSGQIAGSLSSDHESSLYDCVKVPILENGVGCDVEVCRDIIQIVRREPGILNAELRRRFRDAEALGTASYYLRKAGIVVAEKVGSTFRLSIVDNSEPAGKMIDRFCQYMTLTDICLRQKAKSAGAQIQAGVVVVPGSIVEGRLAAWLGHQRYLDIQHEYTSSLISWNAAPRRRQYSEQFGWWPGLSWNEFVLQKLALGLVFEPNDSTRDLLDYYLGPYVSTTILQHYESRGYFSFNDHFLEWGIPDATIRELAGKLREANVTIRSDRMLYHEYQIIDQYLAHCRFELGVPLAWNGRRCVMCDDYFLGNYSRNWDALPTGASYRSFPVCGECVGFADMQSTRRTREQMIADLRTLVDMIGYLPSCRFKDARLLKSLNHDEYIRALRHMHEMACFEITDPRVPAAIDGLCTYREEFGSWLNACVEAGLLDLVNSKSPRGKRCIARDGHECNSLGEKAVDDWLYSRGIEHSKEPVYPFHNTLNPFKMRADWQVGDALIELWGMIGDVEYDAGILRKKAVAEHFGLRLIELTPLDIADGLVKLDLGACPRLNLAV